MTLRKLLTIGFIALLSCNKAFAMRADSLMLERMFRYAQAIQEKKTQNYENYNYTRFSLDIKRKNFTLLTIPSMYAVARTGQRTFIDETYNRVTGYGTDTMLTRTMLRGTTIPNKSVTMENVLKYLTPKIYQETIIENYLISPFARINKRFYIYKVTLFNKKIAKVSFTPRRNNTQLVSGYAIVDFYTGRIKTCYIAGEYDMVDFGMNLTMGGEYRNTLLPTKVELNTKFSFVGNRITGKYVSYYDLPKKDSLTKKDNIEDMRPDKLSKEELEMISSYKAKNSKNDSSQHKSNSKFWNAIGDHTLNRIRQNFGSKGYVRINPILNPLYLGYSQRRGITYKFDVMASYMFSPNSELSTRLKAGYSFKQKQLYLNIPTTWYFDKNRDGYTRIELGNGNHVGNSRLAKHIMEIVPDSAFIWNSNTLNDFHNNYMKMYANIDFNKYFGIMGGLTMHRRRAVDVATYKELNQRYTYHSSAPMVELRLRPLAWQGPVITIDYERSIRGLLNANINYERWEFNSEYIYRLNKLQNFHLKFGTGFYTTKDSNGYFLDYENFRDNIVPGGWNDDWSGEFELLQQETYNQSDYYIRANMSYESPLLILSWLPYVGKYMEMERINVSTLDVKGIHPYIEAGYSFTTRWFSFGMFASMKQWELDAVGIKWGFELFRKW